MSSELEHKTVGKSLYERHMDKIRSAYPTDRQMTIGRWVFWSVLAVSVLILIHIAMTTKGWGWYWMFYVFSILVSIIVVSVTACIFGFRFKNVDDVVYDNKEYKTVYIDGLIAYFIFSMNYLRKYHRWMMITYFITYGLFFITLFSVFLYEYTGVYWNIIEYIVILDVLPDVWKYTKSTVLDEPYSFVNTLYVILYYGIYALFISYIMVSIVALHIWRISYKKMLSEKVACTIIKEYFVSNPHELTLKHKFHLLGYIIIVFMIILYFGLPQARLPEYELGKFGDFVFYELNFQNGTYSVLDIWFFTFVELSFLQGAMAMTKILMEVYIYSDFMKHDNY